MLLVYLRHIRVIPVAHKVYIFPTWDAVVFDASLESNIGLKKKSQTQNEQ